MRTLFTRSLSRRPVGLVLPSRAVSPAMHAQAGTDRLPQDWHCLAEMQSRLAAHSLVARCCSPIKAKDGDRIEFCEESQHIDDLMIKWLVGT